MYGEPLEIGSGAWQTRDGRLAHSLRYMTDNSGIFGRLEGDVKPHSWGLDGRYYATTSLEHQNDLVPRQPVGYPDRNGLWYEENRGLCWRLDDPDRPSVWCLIWLDNGRTVTAKYIQENKRFRFLRCCDPEPQTFPEIPPILPDYQPEFVWGSDTVDGKPEWFTWIPSENVIRSIVDGRVVALNTFHWIDIPSNTAGVMDKIRELSGFKTAVSRATERIVNDAKRAVDRIIAD